MCAFYARKILPVAELTPYVANWTIKVRVTSKSVIRNFDGRRGPGKVFNIDLSDNDGTEIQATLFNEAVNKFYEVLQVGKVYYISRGTIRRANKKFTTLDNNYQLVLDVESTIEEATGSGDVPGFMIQQNFIRIDQLQPYVANGLLLDIIGIVCDVSPTTTIKRKKSNEEVLKREITILDESEQTVKISLWGPVGARDAEVLMETVHNNPVVMVTKLKANSFQGVSLSTTSSSVMTIEPDVDRAHELHSWYKSREKKEKYVSTGMLSTRAVLSDINPSSIEAGESAYYNVRATVSFIDPKQTMWYKACTSCKKKPIERNSKQWCEKCQRDTEICKRYVFQAMIADSTGEIGVTIFDEQGEELLGYTAEELSKIRDEDRDQQKYLDVLKNATWVMKIFRICVFHSEYKGYSTAKMIVREIAPIDWASENKCLTERLG